MVGTLVSCAHLAGLPLGTPGSAQSVPIDDPQAADELADAQAALEAAVAKAAAEADKAQVRPAIRLFLPMPAALCDVRPGSHTRRRLPQTPP